MCRAEAEAGSLPDRSRPVHWHATTDVDLAVVKVFPIHGAIHPSQPEGHAKDAGMQAQGVVRRLKANWNSGGGGVAPLRPIGRKHVAGWDEDADATCITPDLDRRP